MKTQGFFGVVPLLSSIVVSLGLLISPVSGRAADGDELDQLFGESSSSEQSEDSENSAASESAEDDAAAAESEETSSEVIELPEEQPPAAKAKPSGGPRQLEEIIVTATKREASVRDIPISVDAFSGDDLVDQGATQLEDIVRNAPGVTKNGSRVVIRAVATTAVASFVTSEETGRFLGEASLNAPSVRGGLVDFDPYDMRTVEILKGPQATLFGGTALAGAIRYMPNKPQSEGFEAGARAGIGTVEESGDLQREVSAMLNVPLAKTAALRAVGTHRERPGVIDDLHAGREDVDRHRMQQLRVLGGWQPTERLSLDLTYLDWKDISEWAFTDQPDKYETSSKRIKEPLDLKATVANLRAEYALENFSVVGVANYLKNSLFWFLDLAPLLGTQDAPAGTPDIIDTYAKVPSYELRLVSSRPTESTWGLLDSWDYMIGLYYMSAEQQANQAVVTHEPLPEGFPAGLFGTGLPMLENVTVGPDGVSVIADTRAYTDVSERALFFDTTKGLFDDRLELNLGARLAKTQLDILTYTYYEGQQVTPERNVSDDSRLNPKLALTWHFTDDINVRASASQGFRFGGANANVTSDAEDIPRIFDSDTLWNYEVGLRTDLFNRTLRFDTTAFRIDWTDLQITQISSSGQNYVSNVGGARILGVETSVAWQIPDELPWVPAGLNLSSGVSYIDARITEAFDSENGRVPAGTTLPLTPKVIANIGLGWGRAVGSWLLGGSVTNTYSGGRKNELFETVHLPKFNALGASLRVARPGTAMAPAITLSATNLLNQVVPHFGIPSTADSEQRAYVLGRPRTILLSLELSL